MGNLFHGQADEPESRGNRIYEFICKFKREHDGNSPTIREIGEEVGINSTSLVTYYLSHLERDGLIERFPGRSTRINVKGGNYTDPLDPSYVSSRPE